MTRVGKIALGVLLLVGLVTGLVLQPDDGTPVQRPDGAGVAVAGANHAKPLPRTISAVDIVMALAVGVIALVLVQTSLTSARHPERRSVLRSQLLAGRVVAPRGPPAVA